MPAPEAISRRSFLKSSFAFAVVPKGNIAQHGAIRPPLELPAWRVLLENGSPATLPSLTRGRVTALQLMFTACTTTCPMQGAIFEGVQRLGCDAPMQLISLSVDPSNDNPKALREWLARFHAGPAWIGAAPRLQDLQAIKALFGAGRDALDPHSTQTQIIDRSGRLVWRTYELPTPQEIASVLRRVAGSYTC